MYENLHPAKKKKNKKYIPIHCINHVRRCRELLSVSFRTCLPPILSFKCEKCSSFQKCWNICKFNSSEPRNKSCHSLSPAWVCYQDFTCISCCCSSATLLSFTLFNALLLQLIIYIMHILLFRVNLIYYTILQYKYFPYLILSSLPIHAQCLSGTKNLTHIPFKKFICFNLMRIKCDSGKTSVRNTFMCIKSLQLPLFHQLKTSKSWRGAAILAQRR